MKIGAYQFAVSGSIEGNFSAMKTAALDAAREHVRVLVFPECALTGYPPRDISSSEVVDFAAVEEKCGQFQSLAAEYGMYLIVGTITREAGKHYNSAVVFTPEGGRQVYNKRALWGWDRDNFCSGEESGVLTVDGVKIGIRICFEVRFPEYFRELYRERTDLNILLFYDVSDYDDIQRYDMIKAHVLTRAVENVCYTLSVDAVKPFQTAPTALFDRSGCPVRELQRNRAGLLTCDLELSPIDFGEQGRKELSDHLVKGASLE